MTHPLSLDRFEGDIAVLVTDDGRALNIPRDFLPKGVKAGDVLTLAIARDDEATRRLAERTRAIQDALKGRDPGGDLKL